MAEDIPLPSGAWTKSGKNSNWTERQVVTFFDSGGSAPYPRVWLTSDVHTDREENLEWVRCLEPHPTDAVLVAGDVSQSLAVLEETLALFAEKFKRVFFTPGNHDLWVPTDERAETADSLQKLEAIQSMCSRIGVSMEPELLRGDLEGPSRESMKFEGNSRERPPLAFESSSHAMCASQGSYWRSTRGRERPNASSG